MDFFVHESSYVDEGAQIGAGTKIWHFCHVMDSAIIGESCNIGQNVFVAADVTIGNNVKIQNNVSLYTGVVVEDDVFLGPSMVLTNVINPRSHVSRKDEYKSTLIKKGASVGANATIVCGVTLGRYCFIGAGSVVTRDVPDYALIYGNPGRVQGWMCQCGVRLEFEVIDGREQAVCTECGDKYLKVEQVVTPLHTNNGNGVTPIGKEEK
jgi:UDP-2-acetamido-3-amino-2,3-dideoxy-glucuronate N-acetyltransferase